MSTLEDRHNARGDQARPTGAPHRLAALLAIFALALSAITLVRAMGGTAAPRVPAEVLEHEAAIQQTLDKADSAPVPAGPVEPAHDRRPVRPTD